MDRSRLLPLTCVMALVFAGCGGGGSSFDSGPINAANNTSQGAAKAPDAGTLSIFLTDDLNASYDHVWVSIKKIELKLAAGGKRPVFEDPQGVSVDLSALRDDSGPRYRFLNELTIPAGTYIGAEITLAKSALLFPTNSVRGQASAFEGTGEDAKEAVITAAFDPPKLLGGGHDDLVLDFDLSQWKDDGGKLSPVVKPAMGVGLESGDRLTTTVHEGAIDNLKGELPDQTFTLKSGKAAGIAVRTSATTVLLGSAGKPLAGGQTVEVVGTYDANTRRIDATSIQVEDPKAAKPLSLLGSPSAIDSKLGTWTITPSQAYGFIPAMTTMSVTAPESARLFGGSGIAVDRAGFFQALSGKQGVDLLIEGSYDAEKNVFTVTEARLAEPDEQPAVKLGGAVLNPKTDDRTFDLTLSSFEGILARAGMQSTVAVTPTTTYLNDGQAVTAEQFFAALATPKTAAVEGVYDRSTKRVLASTIKLSPSEAKPAPKAKAKK